MSVFIINRVDNFHSYASFHLLGVTKSLKKAIKLIKKEAEEENFKLTKYDIFNLKNINQTQSSDFDGEFNIKEVNLNELL